MFQRVWRCTINPDRADEYERFAREISLPMFQALDGFCGCIMARVDENCEVLTLWDSEVSMKAIAESALYQSTVSRILAAGFITAQHGTTVMPVHLDTVSVRPGAPAS